LQELHRCRRSHAGKKPPAKAGELPYSSGSEGKLSAFAERAVTLIGGSSELAAAQSSGLTSASTTSSSAGPQSDSQTASQPAAGAQAPVASQASVSGINLLVWSRYAGAMTDPWVAC
jgi:hypothetical protein